MFCDLYYQLQCLNSTVALWEFGYTDKYKDIELILSRFVTKPTFLPLRKQRRRLMRAIVFATISWIVQPLYMYFLNPKFQASSNLL